MHMDYAAARVAAIGEKGRGFGRIWPRSLFMYVLLILSMICMCLCDTNLLVLQSSPSE